MMLQSLVQTALARLGRAGFYLLLGLGMVLLVLTQHVHASETIRLQHRDLRVQVPLADLRAFSTNQPPSPSLQQFLDRAQQSPTAVRQWLTTEITVPQIQSRMLSDFVLLQLSKTVGDALGRENLNALRTAVERSVEADRTFSILELLENYPNSQIRLETSRLERVYTDVDLWVTRIQPVLSFVEQMLPDLICECDQGRIGEPQSQQTSDPGESQDFELGAIALHQPQAAVKAIFPLGADANPAPSIALEPSDSPALANKSLVIQFGPFGRSIAMADLTRFAETGDLSRGWRFFFNVAGIDPELVRAALNQEVSADLQFLDRTLNGLLGEFLLYQVGQVLHTPSNGANIQALRSASVLSVAADGRLSLLEVLQRYPTQQVVLNALRLARMGQSLPRLSVNHGIDGLQAAVISLEEWLVYLQASAAESLCVCEDPPNGSSAIAPPADPPVPLPTIAPERVAQFLPADWQPVPPHREDYGILKVVWQAGTPYEMGYQHGQYLHGEIASLGNEVLGLLRLTGRGLGLARFASHYSFSDVIEECRGLSAATQDIGMTPEACMVLAYGDVYQELFGHTLPNMLFWEGCSQWVAAGAATVDGRLYHGSTLDNDGEPLDYILNNPVIFVRQPQVGLPHVFITYPGAVWPNWGVNVAGISLGLDSLKPYSADEIFLQGHSDVQIMAQILRTATQFSEVQQTMADYPSVRANLIMATDGKSQEAGVFEVVGQHLGLRELPESGVLYATNHSVLDAMFGKQQLPPNDSTLIRFQRFAQLMEPGGSHSLHGHIDPAAMAVIGRDRTHPHTLESSPLDVFDDDASPGGNGSLRQGLYDPEKGLIWVAAGEVPVPENPFVCFSLGEMLNIPNAAPCEPPTL
jgi:hypothetical protein